MNDKTPDNCYLAQHGELAGSFCYEDGTLLDNFLIGYVRKATPVYHYRFPITVDTTNDSAVMRSYKDDPAEDPILQGCLNRLSPGVAAAVVRLRGEGSDAARYEAHAQQLLAQVQGVMAGRPEGRVLLQVLVRGEAERLTVAGLGGLLKSLRQEQPQLLGQLVWTVPCS